VTAVLPSDDRPPPGGDISPAGVWYLGCMLTVGLLLIGAQASVFMHGRSNVTTGVMGAAILGCWAYIHSYGDDAK
jgi:hypothetical protein